MVGDGRGNVYDPRPDVFEEITRRTRQTIWLAREPRYSRTLDICNLPA